MYFGINAGINFNTLNPTPLNNSSMSTVEGCAVMSDENGNLLFYTNGDTIWNKNHIPMPNGTGLKGHFSAVQSCIIIPKPGSIDTFYVFTNDNRGDLDGLNYSTVNMNLDGGNGDVITQTKNTQLIKPTTEGLTATRHANCIDFWIITHEAGTDAYYTYLVTSEGVDLTPRISNVGHPLTITPHSIGAIKASTDGNSIAATHLILGTELFSFDNFNGQISNQKIINNIPSSYGIEFSPNNQLLYVGSNIPSGEVKQYDLTTMNEQTIATPGIATGMLQLAPDGKIYIAKENSNSLAVINNPNNLGSLCNYNNDGFSLSPGTQSRLGLTQFIPVINFDTAEFSFPTTSFCFFSDPNPTPNISKTLGGSFSISPNGAINSSSGTIDLLDSGPGIYTVTYTTNGTCPDSSSTSITINDSANASIIPPDPLCQKSPPIHLTATSTGGIWKGTGISDTITGNFDPSNADIGNNQITYSLFNNCGNTVDSITIIVNPNPVISFMTDTNSLCLYPQTPFTFYNTSNSLGGTISNTFWNFGDGSPIVNGDTVSHIYKNSGNYDVNLTITSDFLSGECTNDSTFTAYINVFQNPDADFTIDNNPATILNPTVYFFDQSQSESSIKTWDWNFNNLSSSSQQDPSFSFTNGTGKYTVSLEITDVNNCNDTISKIISVQKESTLYIPNSFTPNGDGINDFFQIVNLGIASENYRLQIFNRWGEMIFESNNINEKWMGTKGGKTLPNGIYNAKIDFLNEKNAANSIIKPINLIR